MIGHTDRLQVVLLADGRLALPHHFEDLAAQEAAWEILGSVRQDAKPMAFVRAQIAGTSWASLVPSARLREPSRRPLVTLYRQSAAPRVPLSGWILFC
jgi:hypothetical protein